MMQTLFSVGLYMILFACTFSAGASSEVSFKRESSVDSIYDEDIVAIDPEVDSFFLSETEEPYYPRSYDNPYKFQATQLIAPAVLLGVGVAGLEWKWWRGIIRDVKDDLQKDSHGRLSFDDWLEFAPALAGYGMNLFGFRGKHNVADATIIYGTAYVLLAATGLTMKYSIYSPRPNDKNTHSFPSGHTAIAFCGAELLRREYWDVSPWIGVAGYAAAAVTGFMRLYNNAHWLNDVLAGAGLGILCAEAAYWLYPVITKTFFKKRYDANIFLAPSVSTRNFGVACAITF